MTYRATETELREELEMWREACVYSITMEGAIYTRTLNRSALERARVRTEERIKRESEP